MPLPTSTELAANKFPATDEPTDAELLRGFISSVHHRASPDASVLFNGQSMPFGQALERERADYLATCRRQIAERKQREARLEADHKERLRP